MPDKEDEFDATKYDPKVGAQGWAVFGRESKFTKLVLEYRWNRQRFKGTKKRDSAESSGPLTDKKIEEYEKVAVLDKLTDLYNPRTFKKKLSYELRRAKRYKRPLSLLIMSIDRLEDLGRQFGRLCIDDCIRSAATIVRQAIRDVDVASRCGDNQIAIIFPETYSSRAVVVGERIREKLQTTPINEDLRGLRVTASIGVVSFPTHARDELDLLNQALEYMETAKSQGGDRVING